MSVAGSIVPADKSPECKIEKNMGNEFPFERNSMSGHRKDERALADKYMIMGYLNSKATKFRLESLEDSLLEELCRKFVDKASSHLEEGL
jgi:hypothetical protein